MRRDRIVLERRGFPSTFSQERPTLEPAYRRRPSIRTPKFARAANLCKLFAFLSRFLVFTLLVCSNSALFATECPVPYCISSSPYGGGAPVPSDEIPALTGFNFGETPELSKSLDTGAQIGKRIVEELSIEIGEPEQPIPPKEAPKVSALEGAKKGKSFGSTEERDFGQDGTDPRDDAVKTAVTQGADIGNTASFEDPSNLLRVPRESVRGVSRLPHSLDSTSDQATKSSEDRTLTATDAGDDPVHAGTGEFTITRTDFSLPGIGLPFYFQRIYRSRWQYESPIGFGWNHTYNQRLVLEDSTCGKRSIIHWITGRGGVVRFEPDPKGVGFQSAPPSPYLLEKKSNGFVITAPDGVTSHFSDGGLLQSTIDLNNNKLTFDWETSLNPDEWRLRQVIDTLGREINFRY